MANGTDIAEALAAALSVIPGVRVHAYAPDTFLPPGIVVQQASMNWDTPDRTFCAFVWEFPIAVAVSRNQDAHAQLELYRIVEAIGDVLSENTTLGNVVNFTRLLTANPSTISSQGIDYPAYVISTQVLA
jgi:hypothetical protein